jgi:hypothetical protein
MGKHGTLHQMSPRHTEAVEETSSDQVDLNLPGVRKREKTRTSGKNCIYVDITLLCLVNSWSLQHTFRGYDNARYLVMAFVNLGRLGI